MPLSDGLPRNRQTIIWDSMGLYLLEMNEEWNDFRLPLVKYGKLKRDETSHAKWLQCAYFVLLKVVLNVLGGGRLNLTTPILYERSSPIHYVGMTCCVALLVGSCERAHVTSRQT